MYITIQNPKQIKSKHVNLALQAEFKTKRSLEHVHLICEFIAPDNVMNEVNTKFRQAKIAAKKTDPQYQKELSDKIDNLIF